MTEHRRKFERAIGALSLELPAAVYRDFCAVADEYFAALPSAPPDLVALRHAWEAGFRLCRNYGDNHHHWDGEQREQRWRGYLASVDAVWSPAPPVAETPYGGRDWLMAAAKREEAAGDPDCTIIPPASPVVAPKDEQR